MTLKTCKSTFFTYFTNLVKSLSLFCLKNAINKVTFSIHPTVKKSLFFFYLSFTYKLSLTSILLLYLVLLFSYQLFIFPFFLSVAAALLSYFLFNESQIFLHFFPASLLHETHARFRCFRGSKNKGHYFILLAVVPLVNQIL